jgi:hypothetical protein
VTKTPVASHQLGYDEFGQPNSVSLDVAFQMKEHSRHVLFCGTHVIQTRYYSKQPVKAVVIRTGELMALFWLSCNHKPVLIWKIVICCVVCHVLIISFYLIFLRELSCLQASTRVSVACFERGQLQFTQRFYGASMF